MNLTEVVTFIVSDPSVDEDGLSALIVALRERQKLNRVQTRVAAQATLREGMLVSIHNIRPKYWNGVTGRIVSFNSTRTRAELRIVDSLGRVDKYGREIVAGHLTGGMPVTCLTVVEEAVAASA